MSTKVLNVLLNVFNQSVLNKMYVFLIAGATGLFYSVSAIASDQELDEKSHSSSSFAQSDEDSDEEVNVQEYLKKAEEGDAEAQYQMALCYRLGEGGVEKNNKEAFEWCQKAAFSDNLEAQVLLGSFYERGLGVNRDLTEAFGWYKKAAEKNDLDAQILVAACYAEGQGVAQNYSESANWYKKAAFKGDPQAQIELGKLYFQKKIDVNKNEDSNSIAYKFFLDAAKKNYPDGLWMVAHCLSNGIGVEKDLEKAYDYTSKYEELKKDQTK